MDLPQICAYFNSMTGTTCYKGQHIFTRNTALAWLDDFGATDSETLFDRLVNEGFISTIAVPSFEVNSYSCSWFHVTQSPSMEQKSMSPKQLGLLERAPRRHSMVETTEKPRKPLEPPSPSFHSPRPLTRATSKRKSIKASLYRDSNGSLGLSPSASSPKASSLLPPAPQRSTSPSRPSTVLQSKERVAEKIVASPLPRRTQTTGSPKPEKSGSTLFRCNSSVACSEAMRVSGSLTKRNSFVNSLKNSPPSKYDLVLHDSQSSFCLSSRQEKPDVGHSRRRCSLENDRLMSSKDIFKPAVVDSNPRSSLPLEVTPGSMERQTSFFGLCRSVCESNEKECALPRPACVWKASVDEDASSAAVRRSVTRRSSMESKALDIKSKSTPTRTSSIRRPESFKKSNAVTHFIHSYSPVWNAPLAPTVAAY